MSNKSIAQMSEHEIKTINGILATNKTFFNSVKGVKDYWIDKEYFYIKQFDCSGQYRLLKFRFGMGLILKFISESKIDG